MENIQKKRAVGRGTTLLVLLTGERSGPIMTVEVTFSFYHMLRCETVTELLASPLLFHGIVEQRQPDTC